MVCTCTVLGQNLKEMFLYVKEDAHAFGPEITGAASYTLFKSESSLSERGQPNAPAV